jgi:DNA-binding transcriptional ArsR family regulator
LTRAFEVLGDRVRRRILEHLARGERSSGEVVELIHAEFGISQPAVSQHLKVLRESGFAQVKHEGARRIYALDPAPLREVDAWLEPMRAFWEHRLDALATEVARGKRKRVALGQASATRVAPPAEAVPKRRRKRARR